MRPTDSPDPSGPAPRPFPHARIILLALAIFLAAAVAADLFLGRAITWFTIATGLGGALIVLGWFYLVRYPKIRRGAR